MSWEHIGTVKAAGVEWYPRGSFPKEVMSPSLGQHPPQRVSPIPCLQMSTCNFTYDSPLAFIGPSLWGRVSPT